MSPDRLRQALRESDQLLAGLEAGDSKALEKAKTEILGNVVFGDRTLVIVVIKALRALLERAIAEAERDQS